MSEKPHIEFASVDLETGWETPPGYPSGFKQKILATSLDETGKVGSRSRLLRIDPGAYSTAPFVHDHWEEVYVLSGDLVVGNAADGTGGVQYSAPAYACRPPGVFHGPFTTKTGVVMFELHLYGPSAGPPAV